MICFSVQAINIIVSPKINNLSLYVRVIKGVRNFRMEKDGKINISGYIDPKQLLKSLKKAKGTEIVHWQYGECSTNLFEKPKSPVNNNKNGAGGYYLNPSYGGYNGYGYNYGYPSYQTNYPFRHLECAGDAADCSGHHIETPMTPDKSSKSIFQKISSSVKDAASSDNGPTCCTLM